MEHDPTLLHRIRHPLLGLAILIQLGVCGFGAYMGAQEVVMAIFFGVVFLLQAAFITCHISLRNWPAEMTTKGRPMIRAVLAGGLLAAVICLAFVYTLLEWPGWWWDGAAEVVLHPAAFFASIIVCWIVWSVVFLFYWKRHDRYVGLTKLTRALLAGSALETLIAAPTIAFVRDPENCFCARGSFFGLLFGLSAVFCVFGPGVLMLYLRQRYIAERLLPLCSRCHYNLTGSVSKTCPECGEPIPQRLLDRIHGDEQTASSAKSS